ncbi:MAG: hypothetical protein KatS3mg114_0897 [Planctomycetaceae bacterium]|nr:MAG: hypothetical protein KatS3mg114_0897 [Planctomycetaceae bacterium]
MSEETGLGRGSPRMPSNAGQGDAALAGAAGRDGDALTQGAAKVATPAGPCLGRRK